MLDTLLKYIDKTDSCWLWKRKPSSEGYGIYILNKKPYKVHRLIAYIFELKDPNNNVFTLDSKYKVCHKCDVKLCCNPNHLFIGTDKDNHHDRNSKGRQAKGSNHGNSILTEEQVIEIRRLFKEGKTRYELKIQFNLNYDLISGIVANRTWKHC